MVQHHKWSLTELEDMLPYERDIYVGLLKNWIEEENQKMNVLSGGQLRRAALARRRFVSYRLDWQECYRNVPPNRR